MVLSCTKSHAEVFSEPVDLMHSLMQDRDDTDIAFRKPTPIDEVAFVAEEVTLNAEFGGDGARRCLMTRDAGEGIEQACDVAICLLLTPPITGIAINFLKPVG